MATWKKLLVSGSSIAVNEITASGHINAFANSVHSIGPITSSGGISASGLYIGKSTAASFIGTASFATSAEGGTLVDGKILLGNGSNVTTAVTPSGDVTMTNAGVMAIGSEVIINADVKDDAAIVQTKLNTNVDLGGNITFGNQTNDTVAFTGPISALNITATGNTILGNATGDSVTIAGNITASGTATLGNGAADYIVVAGNITGSADGTISQSRIITDEVTGASVVTGLTLTTNVTASGQISASLGFKADQLAVGFVGTASFAGGVSDDGIKTAAIADEQVTLAKLAHMAANTVLVRNANSAGDPVALEVTNTQLLIGDGTGFTAAALSSDVTMANNGAVTIANDAVNADKLAANAVVNASITAGAAIAHSKLAAIAATKLLVGNGSNVPVAVALSGDVTMNNAGAVTIGADKVDGSKLTNDVTIAQDLTVTRDAIIGRNISGSGTLDANTLFISTNAHVVGNFTASGHISSSITSTGSFGQIETPTGINFTDDNHSNQGAKIFYTNASSQDKIVIQAGTRNMLEIHNPYNNSSQGEVVVNEDSLDIDFRVESTDKSHMLYVDSENNKVGIGAGAEPGEALEVVGNISASGTIRAGAGTTIGFIGTASFATAVKADGVKTAAIADEQVTLAKLAHMAANTVLVRNANSAGDPVALEVTTTQLLIGDGTGFTAAALSSDVTMDNAGAVTIEADAVTYAKMQNLGTANRVLGATSTGVIGEVQVVTAMIANDAIEEEQIGDGEVKTAALANDAVNADKLAANAVVNASITAGAAIAHSKLAAIAATKLLVGNGSNVPVAVALSGDVTMANTGAVTIGNGKILNAMIEDGGVDEEELANDAVTADKLAANAVVNASITAGAAIAHSKLAAIAATKLLVGNGSNVPVAVALSGDVTMNNAGVVAIGATKIVNAMLGDGAVDEEELANDAVTADKLAANAVVNASITAGAAIAHSKLADLAATKLLVGNGSNVPTAVVLSGDVTMNNAGAVTIANDAVNGDKLADNITVAGNFEVVGTTALGDNTADTVTILGNITHSGTTTLGNAASDFITMAGNLTGSADGTISQSRIFTDTITFGHAETGLTLASNVTSSGQVSASLGFIADQLAIGFIGTASYVNSFAGAGITDGKFLVGNGSDVGTEVNMSGDATMDNAGELTIAADAVDGSKLANDIVIANDLTVTGDLIVNGDTTQLSVTNLNVDDQLILLNSGSNAGDGGIIVQTGGAGGVHIGAGLGFDDSLARWVITGKDQIAHNATAFAPNAQGAPQMVVAVSSSASPPEGNPTDLGASATARVGLMHVETDTGDIYIFS